MSRQLCSPTLFLFGNVLHQAPQLGGVRRSATASSQALSQVHLPALTRFQTPSLIDTGTRRPDFLSVAAPLRPSGEVHCRSVCVRASSFAIVIIGRSVQFFRLNDTLTECDAALFIFILMIIGSSGLFLGYVAFGRTQGVLVWTLASSVATLRW